MSLIREIGRFAGKAAGVVVGGPIQIVGEITGVDLIEDIGKGVRSASEFAGDTVGQVAAGAVDTVSGLINDDPIQRDMGLEDMGSAVSRTAKGVLVTAKNTIHNGGDVIGGLMDGDHSRVKSGASSLVKTVAVGALAVGVVDVIDGLDGADVAEAGGLDSQDLTPNSEHGVIETRNDHLVGSNHPETGIPFEARTVELPSGQEVTGVYPVFDYGYEIIMDESLYLQTDYVHFNYANQELYSDIQEDPEIAVELGLTHQDIQGLANGDTPAGYTWHHNEEPGVLQLVDQETHEQTGHDGGRQLWGGGTENR